MQLDESSLSPALAALLHSRNQAADDALVAALPHLDPARQADALAILLTRDHAPALANVVAMYDTAAPELREQLRAHADTLSASARLCLEDERFEHRRAAIELIRATTTAKCAYLLAEALRHPCRKTVELAAGALSGMVATIVRDDEFASARVPSTRGARTYLVAALRTALSSWPLHLRPEIIVAAAELAAPLEAAILAVADDARSNVSRAFANAMAGAQDARFAGLCLRVLRSQSLRVAASAVLADARTPDFRAALLDDAWLLTDPEVCKSCARARSLACLHDEADVSAAAELGYARAAVRLIAASGGRPHARVELLRQLSLCGHAEAARAAIWALLEDRSDEACEVLSSLSARSDTPLGNIIKLELRRRTYGPTAARGLSAPAATRPGENSEEMNAFEPYWSAFDTLPEESRVSIGKAVLEGVPGFAAHLREKWARNSDSDRSRFLKIVQTLGLASTFADEIYAAARESASHLRSLAVGMLAELNTPASRRLLHEALDDTDDRVQANAIESIERLGGREETQRMVDKLQAPASRVRANAIKALVHLGMREGAGALIEMLGSAVPSDRLSALWVVERMRLQHMLARIERIVADDPDQRVRTRARRLLGKLREKTTPTGRRGLAETAP